MIYDFTGPNPGPTLPHPDEDELCTYIFGSFFDETNVPHNNIQITPDNELGLMELIVKYTNIYAAQARATNQNMKWEPLTVQKLKVFLGICILMGIDHLPSIKSYWTSNTHLCHPGISEYMSRDQFCQIWRYLHLVDNQQMPRRNDPEYDRLFKVRSFLNCLIPKFKANYNPSKNRTVDEAMLPYRGRLSFKQYMKDKPTKWGIKVWELCEAETGYVINLKVYQGKDEQQENHDGLGHRVVMELLDGTDNQYDHIYMDNFFTSIPLFEQLLDRGHYACGTIRSNRIPPEFVPTKAEEREADRGQYDWITKDRLLLTKWLDTKFVFHLSTIHAAEGNFTVIRKLTDGTRLEISCPAPQADYQTYMQGVDRSDRMINMYNVGRKSYKWWRRIFWHGLECAILNSYIIDQTWRLQLHQKTRSYFQFRLALATELIGGNVVRKQRGRPSVGEPAERLRNVGLHFSQYSVKPRDCVVCNKIARVNNIEYNTGRRRVHTVCNGPGCNGVGLCGPRSDSNHFWSWHHNKEFWR